MTDLFKKTAIFSLSVITAIGMMGAIAAPSTANAQSLSSSQIDSIISLLQSFGADQGTIDNVEASLMGEAPSGNTGSDSGSSTATECDFNRDLSSGSQGSDVKCLQEYLNSAGYTVANSGVGSPGNETEYFGSLTAQAVTAWQNANAAEVLQPVGLSSGTGYWGQSSIDYYNQVAAGTGTGTGDTGDTGADTPSSGVDVSAESMDNVSVPRNATLVSLGEFNFASGENTDIESLVFERRGAGDRTDWDRVYVYNDGNRIGSGRTVNTNHEATFSNLNIDLDDGEVTTLTLKGTVSSSQSGSVHYFDLTSANLDNGANVSGLPATGRQVTTANATVGSLQVSNNSPVQLNPELGDQDVEIWNSDLQASDEDMDLESIIVTQYGSVTMADLANYTVRVDGSEENADISVDGDEVTIEFDGSGYFVEDGDNVEVSLRADITGDAYIKGGSGTIQMNIDENNDISAIGRDFGYGANITHGATFGSTSVGPVTINAAELNFSFVGPQTGDIGLSAEDTVLFETELTTAAELEVEDIKFDFAVSGAPNSIHLQDLKLKNKDTGRVLAGPTEIASSSGNANQTFSDVFSLSSGTHNLQVTADVGNDMVNGAEVTVTLDISSLDAENLDTSENINVNDDVIPSDSLAGKKQTFTQPDLSVDNSPTPASQTYVVGKSDTVLGAYVLEASKVSGIDVRQLSSRFSVSSGTTAGLTGSLTLRKGSATGDAIDSQSISSGNSVSTVTFDTSGDLNLAAGEQETVYVVSSIKSDFNPESGVNHTATSSITSVTAKDDDNNDPLFNGSSGTFTDVDGTSFTIAQSGSFDTVAFGGNNPSEDMVITPGSDVLFSSYRLRPTNEDVQMRDFVASIASSTEAKYFDRVKAFVDGSQVSSKVITNATRLFEDVNVDMTKDEDTTFDFKASLVDNFTNLDSGAELELYFATSTDNYDIVGLDSGQSVTFTTSSIDEASEGLRTYQVANSYPSFNFTGSDATLSAGTKNLYKFEVAANNDDVELRELTFDVQVSEQSSSSAGDLQVGSFELLKNGSVVGSATTSDSDSNGTIGDNGADGSSETATTTITLSNVSDYTIGSGDTATFTLRGDVDGVGSDDANSISVNLDNSDEDASFSASDAYSASHAGTTIWSDTYRHFNGAYLDFPTDSQTLSL